MEIILASARSNQIEVDLHTFSNLSDYSTFTILLTNYSVKIVNDQNFITVQIKMHRDFTPLLLNTYLPTFTLTVINQLTNYFIGFELFEGMWYFILS